jgi:hypothetical protein
VAFSLKSCAFGPANLAVTLQIITFDEVKVLLYIPFGYPNAI